MDHVAESECNCTTCSRGKIVYGNDIKIFRSTKLEIECEDEGIVGGFNGIMYIIKWITYLELRRDCV